MFAGDPWYNGQGQQGGVQGMGFRPGPVQIAMVRPAPMPAPTFGQQQMQVAPIQQQTPLLAQAAPQQQYQQQYQQPLLAPQQYQQQQAPPPQAPGQQRIPMGSKANCPVCRNFGG
jgi:hypothetical protein